MGRHGRRTGVGWMTAALAIVAVGCATTVGGSAGDAAADVGATTDASLAFDAAVDIPVDVAVRDAGAETRTCPMVDEDVPAVDVPPADAPYVVDLAVGTQLHQCAVMSDGTVRCMGLNAEGRLGNGRTNEVNVPPTTVPGLRDVVQVVTHDLGATCARLRDGTVRCWGSNQYGMLGTGHADDQDCLGRPCRMSPAVVPGLTDVVGLVSGQVSICAVRRDGSVWCWGMGSRLADASAVPVVTRLTDVAALWPRVFGWVWRLRSGEYRSDTPITELVIPREAELAEGRFSFHLCYRPPDGSVRCLGSNTRGKVGNGETSSAAPGVTDPADPGLCGVRSIATGSYNTCAVLTDRTLWCWGDGSRGALGCQTAGPCTSAGNASRPRRVEGLDLVERVFVGVWGGCALRVDRSVWCWGTLSPSRDRTLAPVAW